jgi:hypothetical protein
VWYCKISYDEEINMVIEISGDSDEEPLSKKNIGVYV